MNRRKIINWSLAVLGIALVGAATWFVLSFFFGPKDAGSGGQIEPSSFYPVNYSGGVRPITGPGAGDTAAPEDRRTVPKLRQLSDVPTAGAGAFERSEGAAGFRTAATIFRWVERATGHIYETRSNNNTKTRISNTTIPGVQEAFFSDDGQSVVARYLRPDNETIETLVGQIVPTTETTNSGYVYSETKLVTRFLEPNIIAAGDAPKDGYFYTVTSRNGGSAVSLARYATSSSSIIFESPLSQWVASWVGESLALQTKADSEHVGYLFSAAAGTDGSEKLIDGRSGLTTLVNPAGTRALFSETVGNDLHLWEKNLETGTERLFELRTLPEKCAWSPVEETVVYCGAPDFYVRGSYPTNWYQGRFSFDDNIWRIEVDNERYKVLHDTRTSDQTFDVWKPQMAPSGDFFIFSNKRDLTLWSLDVSAPKTPFGDRAAGAASSTAATQ